MAHTIGTMKPGPPRTPTALALVRGNPGKRSKTAEPKPAAARPPPPPDLPEIAAEEWRRVVDRLADLGLMSDIDVGALTAYCDAFGEWVSARRIFAALSAANPKTGGFMVRTPNGSVQIAPLVSIIRSARTDMVRFAAEFGMTPSARAGMDINVAGIAGSGAGAKQATAADHYFD